MLATATSDSDKNTTRSTRSSNLKNPGTALQCWVYPSEEYIRPRRKGKMFPRGEMVSCKWEAEHSHMSLPKLFQTQHSVPCLSSSEHSVPRNRLSCCLCQCFSVNKGMICFISADFYQSGELQYWFDVTRCYKEIFIRYKVLRLLTGINRMGDIRKLFSLLKTSFQQN